MALRMPEQAAFGPLFGRRVIEFGQADRAHQGGVGFSGEPRRFRRKRAAGFVNGDAAEQPFAQASAVLPFVGDVRAVRARLLG